MESRPQTPEASPAPHHADAEKRFRALLEAAPDAIVIVNQEGRIELINSQTELMFGYRRDELLGELMEILVPDSLRSGHAAHRQRFAENPHVRRIGNGLTLSARRKDGSEFPAEIGISPLVTQDGLLVISSIRDVTERSRVEEEISKLNSELEERVAQRTTALREANEQLRGEIAERHRLQREILEISEREQQRIGRDLHDDLGQRLVGISYMSQVLADALAGKESPEAAHAGKITELLNNALTLTRSLARGLHPVAMKSGGLTAALTDLAQRSSDIFGVDCDFNGPSIDPTLPDHVATHLYRIAQEAVTNAIHHGNADTIRIELSSRSKSSTLAVTNNGTTMATPDPDHQGMGLRIMKYRADMIGGSLEFSSPGDGKGTVVTCCIPDSRARKAPES